MKANRQKLEIALARACMRPRDLTYAAQMSPSTLKNVFCGRNVRPVTLGRVARALNIDVAEILEV